MKAGNGLESAARPQNISLFPDMVQDFRVQTGSYPAELGGAGGGQINIVTRGGASSTTLSPGPGLIQPRRPYKTVTFAPGTVFPPGITVASTTVPVSTVNLQENTARSWYNAGYVNIRRRYSNGLSLLANYTYTKNLMNAPDFRSPMFESSVPQNNNDLDAEKGSGCDIRHRFSLSAVYAIPAYRRSEWSRLVTQNWQLSIIYQVQTGFPFTISVFSDTANAGTVLGESPIRANYDGHPVYGLGTHTAME